MKIVGPELFRLQITPDSYAVTCSQGKSKFSGLAGGNKPKLYIASSEGKPIYVGQTIQRMGTRMSMGWKADGSNGYHGYKWRHSLATADLHIWRHEDAPEGKGRERDIETVEAEVVFLLRLRTGQWPKYQTEIHFYPSSAEHRRIAEQILSVFSLEK